MTSKKNDWRADLEELTKNFHEQAKIERFAAVERDNALAEELGFECLLDPRRGHGYCRFRRDDIRVWETASHGRVWWMRAKIVDERYTDQTFFETKEDALKNQNSYAKLGKYGSMVRTATKTGSRAMPEAEAEAADDVQSDTQVS